MCEISNQLKLCTCSPDKLQSARNTWKLTRVKLKRNSDEFEMEGIYMPPRNFKFDTHLANGQKIEKMLNAENCFDIEIAMQEGDKLSIYLDEPDEDNYRLPYCFAFRNGAWQRTSYDAFESQRLIAAEGCVEA